MAFAAAPRLAFSQQDVGDARSCTTISNDVARLACYDQAFGVEEPEAAAPRGGPDSGAANALNGNASRVQRPVVEQPIPAPRTAPSAAAERAPGEKAPDIEVTVVEVRRFSRINDVAFVTDDGRVWRQTDGRRVRLPDPPFSAVISEGALGSHFLSPAGQTRAVRVTQQR